VGIGRIAIILSSLAAGVALVSCTATPPFSQASEAQVARADGEASLEAVYSRLAQAGGRVIRLDARSSAVRIYAFPAGSGAKFGHSHVVSAPQFTGYIYLPTGAAASPRFDLEFRLDQLEFDDPDQRSALGGAFARALSPDAVEDTRTHMLGQGNMQADRFPHVRVHSLQISGESPKFAARVQLEMHGQTREMWVPLSVEELPDRASVTGSFVLRQTDFGAKPYSVLGGLLAVQDELVIEFKLVGN